MALEKIGEDSRGNALYVEPTEVGGRRYWSDEVGGGVVVFDNALVSIEMIELAVAFEKAEQGREGK